MNDGWQWLLRQKEKSDIIQIKNNIYVKSERKRGSFLYLSHRNKKKFCKHVVGLMRKEKIIDVLENIIALPLSAKVKRGRPKKSRGALSLI